MDYEESKEEVGEQSEAEESDGYVYNLALKVEDDEPGVHSPAQAPCWTECCSSRRQTLILKELETP